MIIIQLTIRDKQLLKNIHELKVLLTYKQLQFLKIKLKH